MDYITANYSIGRNRIYGSGQSMGGMTVMAMAAQRYNYFAALLPMSCK
ncbi:prolyl oligopeptidase family serine peptidase [Allisonella histaminiformans]|nr:prolyl oligopeptidase family serine peptidase [Allisonella histaminiformans]